MRAKKRREREEGMGNSTRSVSSFFLCFFFLFSPFSFFVFSFLLHFIYHSSNSYVILCLCTVRSIVLVHVYVRTDGWDVASLLRFCISRFSFLEYSNIKL